MHTIDHYQLVISSAIVTPALAEKQIQTIISALTKIQPKGQTLMVVDQEAVAGTKHLTACIHFALKSFEQKTNTAKALGAEILLYLAGKRQINKAIKAIGISPVTKHLLMLQLFEKKDNVETTIFDFKAFLEKHDVKYSNFQSKLETLQLLNKDKIIKNLEIKQKAIDIYLSDKNQVEMSSIIEKLAIEKSALLNLNK